MYSKKARCRPLASYIRFLITTTKHNHQFGDSKTFTNTSAYSASMVLRTHVQEMIMYPQKEATAVQGCTNYDISDPLYFV